MGKAATVPDRPPPTSPLRPRARRIQKTLAGHIAGVLGRLGDQVSAQVGELLHRRGVAKVDHQLTDEEILALADQVAQQVDLGELDTLIDLAQEDLESIALDSARVALAMVGVTDNQQLVDVVNQRAVDYARERSAELVGKRVLEDGTIIDNPSAEWAIDDSTRMGIRDLISSSLANNEGSDAIVTGLEESYMFSPERADMVSRTEIAMANSEAAMGTYRDASAIGISIQKEWILGPEPCDICQENADEGPIGLDETFPSGDDTAPAHPNCECAVIPVVADDAESTEDDGE